MQTVLCHSDTRVLVLGGAGFIGRHAVAALCQRRCQVIVGSRHPLHIDHRLPASAVRCPRRRIRLESLLRPEDWAPLLAGVDVVVNCVGILRQRGREIYQRVHHLAPAALAEACAHLRVRLVHVSALGLAEPAGSRFLRSKADGERAIRAAGGDWRLVRPSLLDGPGGYGARWLRWLAQLPVHACPADANGRIAALHVADLGEALARIALDPLPDLAKAHARANPNPNPNPNRNPSPRLNPNSDADADAVAVALSDKDREFELGGTTALPLAGYLDLLRDPRRGRALQLVVPGWLARIAAHACDVLQVSPYSYGHWELLRRDNLPARNRLPELLGREPRPVGAAAAALPGRVGAGTRALPHSGSL